jgi:serine protease AprX
MKETITGLAENTNVSDNVTINDKISSSSQKISASLSAKIAASTATEQIPVIIMLTDRNVKWDTDSGRAQIENQQKNLISLLNSAKSNGKASDVKILYIINSIAVSITPDLIVSIAKLPEIYRIEYDSECHIQRLSYNQQMYKGI